jgi:very-short-patch-repair endonuclease
MTLPKNSVPLSSGVVALQRVQKSKLHYARNLRREMTSAEKHLWKRLRNRNTAGLKFRRQQVIEGFIADFYCEAAKLVIEVDGDIHLDEDQHVYDEHRTRVFGLRGIVEIRFSNEEVLNRTGRVISRIQEAAKDRVSTSRS